MIGSNDVKVEQKSKNGNQYFNENVATANHIIGHSALENDGFSGFAKDGQSTFQFRPI